MLSSTETAVSSLVVAALASGLLAGNVKADTERQTYEIVTRAVSSAQAIEYVPVEDVPTEFELVQIAHAAEGVAQDELMRRISWCESRWRQFDESGKVLRGEVDPRDSGKFQVNTYYHLADARKLGYDIFTEAGNEAYAWHLLKTQGTQPWSASQYCWSSEAELRRREYPGL